MQTVSNSYSVQAYAQIQNTGVVAPADKNRTPSPSSPQTDDSVVLSPEGQQVSSETAAKEVQKEESVETGQKEKGADQQALTKEELVIVTELQSRDTEVRTHEQAHLAAAGQYANSGASFSYTTGPDGKRYATGGEVSIDISKERSPEATAQKMRTVQRAALAPANPSATDRNVASQAAAKEIQALQEMREESSVAPTEKSGSTGRQPSMSDDSDTSPTSRSEASSSKQIPAAASDFSRRTMNAAYQAMAAFSS